MIVSYNRLQDWIQAKKTNPTHRQLIVVSGPEDWAIESTMALSDELKLSQCLNVGLQAVPPHVSATNTNYRQYLGQEFDGLLYNAYQGFRANAVMALSGTIKREGLMFLLCPELNGWAAFSDPERKKRTSYGFDHANNASAFISRLVAKIKQADDVVLYTPEHFNGPLAVSSTQTSIGNGYEQTSCQNTALQKITKVVTGHRKRPLVIDADRGRGKSSVLGMAAAELLNGHCKDIIITAPNAKACQQAFIHAERILVGSVFNKMTLTLEDKQLRFIPPDVILATKPKTDLLLVDEAAAIPTPVLKQLLSHYNRMAFSTTVHGYEGSGRGFEIRFKKHLDTHTPDWQSLHLSEPIRWNKGDTLEDFWFDALLMKESATANQQLKTIDKDSLSFEVLQGKSLITRLELLSNIFSLMVNAHYQTVPDDLQRLLDSPDHFILVAKCNTTLVGVILYVSEPAYLSELTDDIHCGKRRVNGHLLSQSLCFHCGIKEATALTYIRTVRIAVNPQYQQQGIGSKLLQQLKTIAAEQQVDMLGTSFGLEEQLLNFWQKNNYHLIRIGHQKDASSGEHSGLMLSPTSAKANPLLQTAHADFSKEFAFQLSRHFKRLPYALVIRIIGSLSYPTLPQHSLTLIHQFSLNERPIELVERLLDALLLNTLSMNDSYRNMLTASEIHTLVSYVLQNQAIEDICSQVGLTGKKELKKVLVNCISKLLNDM
jgi:tRNA(Met) cytidine acetyltransferase